MSSMTRLNERVVTVVVFGEGSSLMIHVKFYNKIRGDTYT